MSSKLFEETHEGSATFHDTESGYASGSSSQDSIPEIYFSKPHLKFLNSQLQKLEPLGMVLYLLFDGYDLMLTYTQISCDGASQLCQVSISLLLLV
jgi:hypothetical protein